MARKTSPYRVTIVVADKEAILATAECTATSKGQTEVKLAVNPVVNFLALRDLLTAIAEQLETSYYNAAQLPTDAQLEALLSQVAHYLDESAGQPF